MKGQKSEITLKRIIFKNESDKIIIDKMTTEELMKLRVGDPMGTAIYDYYKTGKAGKLIVMSSQFEDDEMPVDALFRGYDEMPAVEKHALNLAEGRILDVGAGSGCHSVVLKSMGKECVAIDISALSVEVMKERGVDGRLINFYDEKFTEKFDTILMLMNGSGIIGKLENMPQFFAKAKELLKPGGCILMDSSDLCYLYEDEDGSMEIDLADEYYGLIDYKMQYEDVVGNWFDCLYIDYETLSFYANENGFNIELITEGNHYDYLAKLTVKE